MPIKGKIIPIYNCFHPVLREQCKDIFEADEKLAQQIADMAITMTNADGIGLAANQVGFTNRIFLIDINAGKEGAEQKPFAMINPVITASSEEEVTFQEGCLSIPYLYENVDRPEAIEVRFLDNQMNEQKIQVDGIIARVIMHELDHLNGILFTDKMTSLQKAMAKNKLNKILKNKISLKYDMIDKDGNLIKPESVA